MTSPYLERPLRTEAEVVASLRIRDAAPDLLAALKAAIPFLEAEQRTSDFEVLPLTKAHAAIVKARNQ